MMTMPAKTRITDEYRPAETIVQAELPAAEAERGHAGWNTVEPGLSAETE